MESKRADRLTGPAQQTYDRLAEIYDRRWRRYIDATIERAVDGPNWDGPADVLDVACGTGELLRQLRRRQPELRLVGADLSWKMLEQAKAKMPTGTASWVQADAATLPFIDACFDAVFCINSLHYFPRPQAALREIRRVLRPDGCLVMLDWCDDYLSCKLYRLGLGWSDPALHRIYSLRACRRIIEQTGFTITRVSRFRAGWFWGMMRVDAVRKS